MPSRNGRSSLVAEASETAGDGGEASSRIHPGGGAPMSEGQIFGGEELPPSKLGIGEQPRMSFAEAELQYICAVARRPTRSELDMARQVQIEVERIYEFKKRQLYALALTENGTTIGKPQADFGNGSNICAEMAVFFANSEPVQRIRKLTVAHMNNPVGNNPGHVHLASMCGSCRERWLEHHPDAEVIMSYKGEIIVVRLEVLLPLAYKRRMGEEQVHTH
jgi:cytidine deaminase